MTGLLEDIVLRTAGLNDADIAELNTVQDDIDHIIATIRAIWPRIQRAGPVVLRLTQKVAEFENHLKPPTMKGN